MNPGVSLQVTVFLPTALPQLTTWLYVSSEVSGILIISNNFITGTGLKKWRPTKRSFLEVGAAISPMGSEEVLEAKIVC